MSGFGDPLLILHLLTPGAEVGEVYSTQELKTDLVCSLLYTGYDTVCTVDMILLQLDPTNKP